LLLTFRKLGWNIDQEEIILLSSSQRFCSHIIRTAKIPFLSSYAKQYDMQDEIIAQKVCEPVFFLCHEKRGML
jgi:hypothetical protein